MASLAFELKAKTVFVAGHRGMVGSALVRRLAKEDVELLTASRGELDLRDQAAVNEWFSVNHPQVVFL
jgi:GDP-L-fucose synthase